MGWCLYGTRSSATIMMAQKVYVSLQAGVSLHGPKLIEPVVCFMKDVPLEIQHLQSTHFLLRYIFDHHKYFSMCWYFWAVLKNWRLCSHIKGMPSTKLHYFQCISRKMLHSCTKPSTDTIFAFFTQSFYFRDFNSLMTGDINTSDNWVMIDAGNGWLPDLCQVITWTTAGCLLIGPLGANFFDIWMKIQ